MPNGFVNIVGVTGNEVTNLKIAQAKTSVETMANGPIVEIMSQCVNFGQGEMFHSEGQMEHFGALIDNNSHTTGENSAFSHLRDALSPHMCGMNCHTST